VGCSEKHGTYFEYRSSPLSEKVTIDYELSNYDAVQNSFVTSLYSKKIDPKRTALVIIDLWPPKFLDSLTIKYINPLIEEVDSLGMKVIYSPSSGPFNRHLEKIENGIYFFNQDMMDKYLLDNKIENLIYIGFDPLYCVLDKPNGIYSYQARNNEDIDMFALDIGLLSTTKEMKQTALELFKKNNIGVIKSLSMEPRNDSPEKTLEDVFGKTRTFVKPGNHFVVIFEKDSVNDEFNEFKSKLKNSNIEFAEVINGRMTYQHKEIPPHGFVKLLRDAKVNNLYYSGYHINNEILWSDYGLISLYIKHRYNKVPIPRLYFINDLVYTVPSDKLPHEVEKYTIINHYRGMNNIMSSTLLEGVLENEK